MFPLALMHKGGGQGVDKIWKKERVSNIGGSS